MIINNCYPWKVLSQYFNFYLKVLTVKECVMYASVFIHPNPNSIWQRSDYPPLHALFYHPSGKPLDEIEPFKVLPIHGQINTLFSSSREEKENTAKG